MPVVEFTKLVKANPKFNSLRTTVPMSLVKEWELKEGATLVWEWQVVNGKMTMTVRKK